MGCSYKNEGDSHHVVTHHFCNRHKIHPLPHSHLNSLSRVTGPLTQSTCPILCHKLLPKSPPLLSKAPLPTANMVAPITSSLFPLPVPSVPVFQSCELSHQVCDASCHNCDYSRAYLVLPVDSPMLLAVIYRHLRCSLNSPLSSLLSLPAMIAHDPPRL